MTLSAALPEPLMKRPSRRGEPTWEMAGFYPVQGTWSEEKYLALQTNHLIEFVDGCLEFLPMPTLFHQAIVAFLFELLNEFVQAHVPGEVFFAPCRIRTISDKIREPDVLYIRPHRVRDRFTPPKGADLVIEVVSGDPEDRQRDLKEKRAEYAKARIPEYWIVDPEQHQITVLTLKGTRYSVHGKFGRGDQATSVLLSGFSVTVNGVFAAGLGKLPQSTK
jgi:Uma2 family endonuclease